MVGGAGSLEARARRLESTVRASVVEIRATAASVGARRIRNELLTLGVRSEVAIANLADIAAEIARASRIATNYARDWLTIASSTGKAQAASEALRPRTVMIAATETASSYNEGRAKYIRRLPRQRFELLKVWDARLDRRTCPTCSDADGTIVGYRERFPLGEPGGVHPLCRCTETILRSDEVEGETLIQPVRLAPAA